MSSRARILALWLLGIAGAAAIVARAHYITDLSAFLPAKRLRRSNCWSISCAMVRRAV